MSQFSIPVLDADGHVTESYQQIAKYLDEPYRRRRPLTFPLRRVPERLAPTYETPFSAYGDYRPWRAGLLRNIERTYAMVS